MGKHTYTTRLDLEGKKTVNISVSSGSAIIIDIELVKGIDEANKIKEGTPKKYGKEAKSTLIPYNTFITFCRIKGIKY